VNPAVIYRATVHNAYKIHRSHDGFQGKALMGNRGKLEELWRWQTRDKKSLSEISRALLHKNTEGRWDALTRPTLCKC